MRNLLPLIEHRICARHIYARRGKKHPGKELKLNFWNVARSATIPEMQNHLQSMKKLNGGEKAAEELLGFWPIEG